MTTRKIAFEDIRVGDTIRATATYDSGDSVSRTAVITEVGPTVAEGIYVSIGWAENYEYELVSRPTPEEPKGLGAVVLFDGIPYIQTGDDDGLEWRNSDEGCDSWERLVAESDLIEVKSEGVVL